MLNDPQNKIIELAEPIVRQEKAFLVDVEINQGKELVIWLYVDGEEGGVDVDACSRISRELGFLLDANEVFTKAYRLNISSPGLSRPLKDIRQYPKNKGRKARVKYNSGETVKQIEGILKNVSDSGIEIETEKNGVTTLGFDTIVETKILPTI